MFHEHAAGQNTSSQTDRRVTVTFFAGESAWLIVLAFIVVTTVVIYEIITRRSGKRSSVTEIEDRSTDGR